jgi:hypothetical protein
VNDPGMRMVGFVVRRAWAGLIALVGVIALVVARPDPVRTICPSLPYGWQRPDPNGLCLPTLFPSLTGANPVFVIASWVVTWAVIAGVVWFVVTFVRRKGDV